MSFSAFCQETLQDARAQIQAVLDSWQDRATAREAILKLGPSGFAAVQSIAKAGAENHSRRSRAIALLATFKSRESIQALEQITGDKAPLYRCLAIQALTEIGSEEPLPILVRKLDDRSVCMKTTSTDPAEEHDVLVSDEAVRGLEKITGLSFERGKSNVKHRATRSWKDWWRKRHK
ncbi:MAG: HEAT repeat domain-containing protein [Acidobacteriota bacterium]